MAAKRYAFENNKVTHFQFLIGKKGEAKQKERGKDEELRCRNHEKQIWYAFGPNSLKLLSKMTIYLLISFLCNVSKYSM
jgi:hypothetical protein